MGKLIHLPLDETEEKVPAKKSWSKKSIAGLLLLTLVILVVVFAQVK